MNITLHDIRLRTCQSGIVLLLTTAAVGLAAEHFQIVKSGIAGWTLLQSHDGVLYGAGSDGGLFRINKDGTGYNRFSMTNANDLLEGSDGVLYGTRWGVPDGENGPSTAVVFRLNKDGTDYGILHTFSDAHGDAPGFKLTEGTDGRLYGTTEYGGIYTNENLPWGSGTAFRLNKDGTGYSIIHHFGALEADGFSPLGRLLQGSDGVLYGTTWLGGSNHSGTVFKLATDGTSYTILKHFESGSQGGIPVEGMIEGSDGVLYGTTGDWMSPGNGTVFRLNKDGTGFHVLLTTDWLPSALAEGPDGALYGVTQFGGQYTNELGGFGTLFRLNKDGAGYTSLHDFSGGADGSYPGKLILGNDGAFYGVVAGGRTLFRLWPPETPDIVGLTNIQGVARFTVLGIAGYQYQVLRSLDLQNWSVATNLVMPPLGFYVHTDNAPLAPGAFYRAVWSVTSPPAQP